MEKETTCCGSNNKKCRNKSMCGSSGALYGLGVVGALVYFIQHSDTLLMGLLGVLKAFAWPALFVYKLLEFLKF